MEAYATDELQHSTKQADNIVAGITTPITSHVPN